MDWHLTSISRQSTASGHRFSAGDAVVSYLLEAESGEITRADILRSESEKFVPEGKILGWWEQVLRDYKDEAEARRQALRTTEGLFLSLFPSDDSDEDQKQTDEPEEPDIGGQSDATSRADDRPGESRESAVLKLLLATALERRRILKPFDPPSSVRAQRFLHRASGREFAVPAVEMTPESVMRVCQYIGEML